MRARLRHASGFKALVDFMCEVDPSAVGVQLGDGGGLAVWRGPAVGAFPAPKRDERVVRFELCAELLSVALECVQHRDELVLEWSGRDTVQLRLTHPSKRATDIDFPILRMTEEGPPAPPGPAAHERRISAAAYARILHRLLESAAAPTLRVTFWEDGIDFRGAGEARFGMRTWHPTHPAPAPPSGVTACVAARALAPTAALRAVDSVVTLGLEGGGDVVVSARGKDGLVVTTRLADAARERACVGGQAGV